ncbi:MAG: NIPSNAP family protein [Deferribacteres bacterium]|nr:NIPSNAP family protein [candidate division KSB1 bacterium]MCB9503628.1 NIPSNAP family protein [Deferribacteres bacterium]
MTNPLNRRDFLKTSVALTALAGAKNMVNAQEKSQEYYELRIYKTADANKMKSVHHYLENALVPAFGRMGLDRIGVFTNMDNAEDYSIYMLIPYPTLAAFAAVNPKLQADTTYLNAAKNYFAAPKEDPVFTRIQSKFYKAFQGMPVIELPQQTLEKQPRLFELRIYESHTEEKAALKVDMFNSGEIQVMRDTGLAPVFYGEALIGDDVPNLTYMLSASDREAHKEHWRQFGAHPEWQRMKEMPKYKDTVSKITNIFLQPAAYSQL